MKIDKKEAKNEHQRDSVVAVRRINRFPFNLENGLDECFRMAGGNRIYSRDYRRGACLGLGDNFALDREVKNVRPAGFTEGVVKNQNTGRRKKMKKVKILLVILITITLYANIGWVVGSYYYNNVLRTPCEKLTTLGKVAAGGWSWVPLPSSGAFNFAAIFVFGIIWPVGLAFVAASWIVYAAYYAVGWFIFAGGAAELLGLV